MRVSVFGQLTLDEGINELNDFALLVTRQATDLFKDLADFASGTSLVIWFFFDAQEVINGNVENLGQAANLVRPQRDVVAFPSGITRLTHVELFGNFSLRQTQSLPRFKESLAERRTGSRRWSSLWHIVIIRRRKKTYCFCLHKYCL